MGTRPRLRLKTRPDAFLRAFHEDLDALTKRVERIFKGSDKDIDINVAAYRQLRGSLRDCKVFCQMGLSVEDNMEIQDD